MATLGRNGPLFVRARRLGKSYGDVFRERYGRSLIERVDEPETEVEIEVVTVEVEIEATNDDGPATAETV